MNWFNDIKIIQNLLHTTIGEKKIVNHLYSPVDTIFCLDFPPIQDMKKLRTPTKG